MRVFVSIRPSADARLHLQNALDEVRQTAGQSLRWSDADQWHLTLAFRPDLPEGAVRDALEDLAATASGHGPLTLPLSGGGSFSGRPLSIGVGAAGSRLESLMREGGLGGLDRAGRRPRRRRRWALPAPDPTRTLLADAGRALSVYRGPAWESTELELVASHLGQGRFGGPLHEVLGTVPLGP